MKREKGITLMALVITIIVLLLLAGISITMLSGDNGIIRNAGKSKMQTEIATLKEGLELKDARMQSKDNYKKGQLFGDMEEVLGEEYKRYKDRYSIEAGNIVYKDKKFSREEIEILEENGIEKESKHYLIMNESTKASKYEGNEDAITLKEMQEKITSKEFSGEEGKYNKAYIIEDLDLGAKWDEEGNLTSGEQWTPITQIPENTVLDGCGYEISGIYINTTKDNQGLISINNGVIKSIILSEKNYINNIGGDSIGGICGINETNGIIKQCENKTCIISKSESNGELAFGTGGVCANNKNLVTECKNYAVINGAYDVGGIIGGNITNKSEVNLCVNLGTIFGDSYACGGIVGGGRDSDGAGGRVSQCINVANVKCGNYGRCWNRWDGIAKPFYRMLC